MSAPEIGSGSAGHLVVGLGNPGTRYGFTRHNAGFMVLDRMVFDAGLGFEPLSRSGLVCRGELEGARFYLLKPLTFMNLSGEAVVEAQERWQLPVERVFVVSDDFNLPLGRIRIRARGSDGGHKGLKSIIDRLGTETFPRLRIGVGPVPGEKDPAEFVLEAFTAGELETLQAALVRAADAVHLWLTTGDLDVCMSRYNVEPGTD